MLMGVDSISISAKVLKDEFKLTHHSGTEIFRLGIIYVECNEAEKVLLLPANSVTQKLTPSS